MRVNYFVNLKIKKERKQQQKTPKIKQTKEKTKQNQIKIRKHTSKQIFFFVFNILFYLW